MTDSTIGVHVIGPGYGESIVIEFPDATVGVIDAFSAPYKPPPLLAFLDARFPGLGGLRFLACTHPHADHLFGAACLAKRFKLDEFWVFQPFPAGLLHKYYDALTRAGGRDELESAIGLPAGSMSLEIERLYDAVPGHERIPWRYLQRARTFRMCGGTVAVHRLTPDDQAMAAYNRQLSRADRSILEDDGTLRASSKFPTVDHNLASGSLMLRYGDTRLLLMADAEEALWRTWCDEAQASADIDGGAVTEIGASHFIKVAHHGSANGYFDRFYAAMASRDTTLAVITPFNGGKTKLPSADGVSQIARHVREVCCTNGVLAGINTGLPWDQLGSVPVLPSVPPVWISDCQRAPDLLGFLEPSVGGVPSTVAPRAGMIPPRWMRDCQQQPALVRLLQPRFRNSDVSPAAPHVHEEFRFSVYYDDRGNEVRREPGYGVGRLRQ